MNPFPIDQYSTHFPVLLAAATLTDGPVLEMGCGSYSTLMLHAVCLHRPLLTLETDSAWFARFAHLQTARHTLRLGQDYDEFDQVIRETPWSVVLIDHAPVPRRNVDLVKVPQARYIVIHDTNWPAHSIANVRPLFRYHLTSSYLFPWTSVLSNQPLDPLARALPNFFDDACLAT